MEEKILQLRAQLEEELTKACDGSVLEGIRVAYLGKKGSVTELLKGLKDLSDSEKKEFGQKVNVLKNEISAKIDDYKVKLAELEVQKEINEMPEFDLSIPANMERGSYHPITLVQRECETIFKSMGFTVEDYTEIVSEYECFESLNIPKHHPVPPAWYGSILRKILLPISVPVRLLPCDSSHPFLRQ